MQANERRFRQRYNASPLTIEVRSLNWLGRPSRPFAAQARNFAIGGMGILTANKLKPGKRLLINLANSDHRLQAIPAVVLRCDQAGDDFICALKFALGELPEPASRAVYTVLQRLEGTLKQPEAA
ncbi:PilZ domain-containing protein [Thalassolituus marinus]|uniref:PilZ domain-containing protein n=1 Tax=Thalassolituus marinus TaxID=671053 RepID=A0ABS7ZTR5_9GAMM|nr:PilZ domain-containing protein [Thalassolituus marinus]MCA6063945.1 PilZ domain-containing protein [Thalassolituus marinus]